MQKAVIPMPVHWSAIGVLGIVSLYTTLTVVHVFSGADSPYGNLWVLPASYIVFLAIVGFAFGDRTIRVSLIALTFLFFLQSVAFPLAAALVGEQFIGRRYLDLTSGQISRAIFLTAYSNLVLGLVAVIISKYRWPIVKSSWLPPNSLAIRGSKLFYTGFVLFAAAVYVLVGRANELVSFFLGASSTSKELNTALLLARQIIIIAITLIFLLVLNFCRRRYLKYGRVRYVILALIVGLLLVGTIVGDRRSVQLFNGALVIWLLVDCFPSYRRRIVFSIVAAALVAISSITLHRGSVIAEVAMAGSVDIGQLVAEYIQVYAGGVDSVATGMLVREILAPDVGNLAFDFARTTFGPSFFLRDLQPTLSEAYNNHLYYGAYHTGQLIFAVSYGWAFLGFAGAPIFLVLNLVVAVVLERLFRRSLYLEVKMLLGYCFFRVVMNLLVSTPNINTVVTLHLGTFGFVVALAVVLRKIDRPYRKSHPNISRVGRRFSPLLVTGDGSRV